MQTLGAFEVKTHLSELLREIETKKETIAITRHGKVVALLTPPEPVKNTVAETIKALEILRKGVTLGKNLSLKKMISEGRR